MSATEQGFAESDKHMPTTFPVCFSITAFRGSWQKGNILEKPSIVSLNPAECIKWKAEQFLQVRIYKL